MQHEKFPPLCRIMAGAVLLVGITACSDGGNEGSGPSPASSKATGVASKGIIQAGLVTAQELSASGTPIATVGTTITGDDGRYNLTINSNYEGGPLLLTISGQNNGSTKMICDVTAGCGGDIAFGDPMPIDPTFEMTAILPPLTPGQNITAQITPFTHMATRRALATGTIDADTVNNAISEVNQIVGANILETEPVDITDPGAMETASSEELAYAIFLAGAGRLALERGNLQEGLDALATSFEDGVLDSSDTVGPDELLGPVETEAMENSLDTNTMAMVSHVLTTIRSGIEGDCESGTCSFDPEPADSATLSALGKARKIIEETRTWGNTLAKLETPADIFGGNMEVAGDVLDQNNLLLTETLGIVLDAVGLILQGGGDSNPLELGTHTVDLYNGLGQVTITLYDNNGLNINIDAPNLTNGVSIDLLAESDIPASDLLALHNTGAPLTLNGLNLAFSGTASNTEAALTLDKAALAVTFESSIPIDPAIDTLPEPVLTSANLSGDITMAAAGASFSGSASIEFVALDNGPSAFNNTTFSKLSLKRIALGGTFSDALGNSFEANASLVVNNASQVDTLGVLACDLDIVNRLEAYKYIGYYPGAYLYISQPGDSLNATTYAANELGIYSLEYVSYSAYDNTTYINYSDGGMWDSIEIAGDVLGARNYFLSHPELPSDCALPPQNIGEFWYSYQPADGFYQEGSYFYAWPVDYPPVETSGNFANITLTLSMNLALKGYPDTSVILTANRTSFRGGDLTATLLHDGRSVTFEAIKDDESTPGTGQLYVTTPDGTELAVTITEGEASGTVTVDETVVATVESTDNGLFIVRYKDGTFETLH